jgi:acetyl-CoA C-acetyltransferase
LTSHLTQFSRPLNHSASSSSSSVAAFSTSSASNTAFKDSDVVILSATRTPIGAFQGSLSSLTGIDLGVFACSDAISKAKIQASQVNDVILGNVVSSNLGQAPATQVTLRTGLPSNTPATTINKVCSSGLKSVMFAAQTIQTGQNDCVLAGGFESMSNIPYYLSKGRTGYNYGNQPIIDGILRDGLWDPTDDHHMGNCAEACAKQFNLSRKDQDEFAIESYKRAQNSIKTGLFKAEITPVKIKNKKGEETIVDTDEEPSKLIISKVPSLKPAFQKDGTVTAANASAINDGNYRLL